MYHIAVFLEHVDLLNCLDWLNVQLLQGSLELLVISARGLVNLLCFPSWGALSSVCDIS